MQTWADIAADIFERRGRERSDVIRVSTSEYARLGAGNTVCAPRPAHSALPLKKIHSTGFAPPCVTDRLSEYLSRLAIHRDG